MSTPARVWPVTAALFTGIQVGAAIVASRYVIDQTTPATLALLRYAIGFCCLAPLVLILSKPGFLRRDILPIAILGILQFGILIALLNFSLQYLTAARVALIFSTFPLQTMLLAALLGREALTWRVTAAVLMTIAGIAVALGEALWHPSAGRDEWIGVAAVSASAFVGALCSIFYRPYLQRYPALNVSALAMLASVLFLFVYSAASGGLATVAHLTMNGWAAVLFVGVSSGGGYVAWLYALKYLPATRVTLFLSLGPISSALLGVALLGEKLSLPLTGGMVLVIAGLILALRKKDAKSV
jgi:drug/metabolite transporter (DMT)-like permease